MDKNNKYWNLSWWYIFDNLDKKSHELAIKQIWECETISSNINYLWKIRSEEIQFYTSYLVTKVWENKVFITANILNKIFATFIFIKIKKWKN